MASRPQQPTPLTSSFQSAPTSVPALPPTQALATTPPADVPAPGKRGGKRRIPDRVLLAASVLLLLGELPVQFPVLAADVVHRDRLHLRGQGPRLRWNRTRRFDERGHDRRLVGAPKKPGRGDHHQQHKQHRQHRQQQRNTGGPRPLEGSQLLLQGFGSGCLDQSRGGTQRGRTTDRKSVGRERV